MIPPFSYSLSFYLHSPAGNLVLLRSDLNSLYMTEENFTCDICGKSFDSKRGLSVHQSQMHGEERQDPEDEEVPEPYTGESKVPQPYSGDSISLSVRHVMIGVFVLGLAVGFSAGIAATNFDGLTGVLADGEASQQDTDSGESTTAVMKDIASEIGIDADQMEQYIESSSAQEIQQDRQEISQTVGGIGTPTFYIGNSEIGYTEVSGAQPYSRMKPLIEQKLQEASNGSSVGEDEYTLENISFEGEPKLGEEDAPINIIEYSDFGCPWCAEWHGVDAIPQRPIDQEQSFTQVRNNYVETGEVQFVMKDYPVPRLHPEAVTAHKAANYVWENSPDDYWEFSQRIYETRDRW